MLPAARSNMSSTRQEQVGGTGGEHMREEEHGATVAAVVRSKALEVARNGFAGATAGAVSRVLTAPFDVAKIRFQLDHGATRRYDSSVWAAMRSIYGEEGLVTLWRGNLPAMFLWSAYTAVQFCTYEQLRSTDSLRSQATTSGAGFSERQTSREGRTREGGGRGGQEGDGGGGGGGGEGGAERGLPPALSNFVYGAIAAFTATLVTYPLDITRTALAFQGVPKRYNSMSEFIGHTLREAGPRGLFRGATPTLAMITPQMGVSFAVWEALRGSPPAFVTAAPVAGGAAGAQAGAGAGAAGTAATVAWQLGAGAIAGMTGKLVAFPLDTVKKRVQTAVMLERDAAYGVLPRYAGPAHALRTVFREEGALALFRGSVPAMWKSGLSTAVTYAVYEWVRAGAGTVVALER